MSTEYNNKESDNKELDQAYFSPAFPDIDYNIGDILSSIENKEIGICTGFSHNNTCVDINGKCYGGRTYFMKYKWIGHLF